MQWHVETLGPVVDAEIDALPVGLRAKLLRLMVTVQDFGLDQLREPHVKHVEGKLWELRVSAREGIARGIYVTQSGGGWMYCMCLKRRHKRPHSARSGWRWNA